MTNKLKLIYAPQVAERLDRSERTIWRWTSNDPSFPKPIHLSRQSRAWDEAEIDAWIEAKKAARARSSDTEGAQ